MEAEFAPINIFWAIDPMEVTDNGTIAIEILLMTKMPVSYRVLATLHLWDCPGNIRKCLLSTVGS